MATKSNRRVCRDRRGKNSWASLLLTGDNQRRKVIASDRRKIAYRPAVFARVKSTGYVHIPTEVLKPDDESIHALQDDDDVVKPLDNMGADAKNLDDLGEFPFKPPRRK
jgi:hypothetical protein